MLKIAVILKELFTQEKIAVILTDLLSLPDRMSAKVRQTLVISEICIFGANRKPGEQYSLI
jgi:hypothetical protein